MFSLENTSNWANERTATCQFQDYAHIEFYMLPLPKCV